MSISFLPRNQTTFALILGGVFILGGGIGWWLSSAVEQQRFAGSSVTREGGYQFVNPLLSCDINEDAEYPAYEKLQRELQSEVNNLITLKKVTRISVYVRNMNQSRWTGVNVDANYIPASLMKVPLMIAYLHESEKKPTLLAQNLTIPQGIDKNKVETIRPAYPLALGANYSIQTLMDAMIVGSDNNAASVLNDAVATTSINDAYDQLGVPPADENSDSISPKAYMRVFRILFNASYISRTKSQSALKLLSETEFKDGIVAGVPAGVPVAHKFGERTVFIKTSSNTDLVQKRELHDCGIVYYPRNPYGICIMTEGKDFDDLAGAIASVSKIVYKEAGSGLLSK